MPLYYKQPPGITTVAPQGDNVPLDARVEIGVTADLDRTVLPGAVSLLDPRGQSVPGDLVYADRTIRFTPSAPLEPDACYTIWVRGTGTSSLIRTLVGVPLGSDYTYTFRTVAAQAVTPPVLLAPADGLTVTEPLLAWTAVPGAVRYLVQVWRDPALTRLSWSGETTDTQIAPAPLTEDQFWWRVAGIDAGGHTGPFSSVGTFVLSGAALPVAAPGPAITPAFYYHAKTVTQSLSYLECDWPPEWPVTGIALTREDLDGTTVEVPLPPHIQAGGKLRLETGPLEDGSYVLTIEGGPEPISFTFLIATGLYATVRQVRQELGRVLEGVTAEEIGLALWSAGQRIDTELELAGIDGSEYKLARSRCTLYLACAQLVRRLLMERSAAATSERRTLGDTSIELTYSPAALEAALARVERELKRWSGTLLGRSMIRGAVRGGSSNPYPLGSRVWSTSESE